MKLKVDQQADALYLSLSEAPASRSEEVSPGDHRRLRRTGSRRRRRNALPFEAGTRKPTCIGCCSNLIPLGKLKLTLVRGWPAQPSTT